MLLDRAHEWHGSRRLSFAGTETETETELRACTYFGTHSRGAQGAARSCLPLLPHCSGPRTGAGLAGGGLFEVRTTVDGNVYRVLFCLEAGTMVLLHGFHKKTQKTSKADLDLARRRRKAAE